MKRDSIISFSLVLAALSFSLGWLSVAAAQDRSSVRPIQLRISPNGRHLIDQNGKPFLYLADTAWTLFRRLNRDEVKEYLQDRAAKGFSVTQAYLLRGLNVTNRYGELTLINRDPTKPNEAWFKHADYVINRANELGLVMGIVVSKGDHVRQRQWPVSEVVFNETNSFTFGKFLGDRYKNNAVIWYLGGDTVPAKTRAVWVAMARGLKAGSQGRHLLSYHGPGGEQNSSSYWFQNEDWLDFNAIQSGHGWFRPSYQFVARDYALKPVKPTIDMESTYEDHAPDPKRQDQRTDGHQIRVNAYWNFLSGAAGHGYGCNDIWQFANPASPPGKKDYTFPFDRWSGTTDWHQGMDLPGAKSMGILRQLLESRPWYRLVPDNSLIAAGQGEGKNHVQAALADDGSVALAYLPFGNPVSVRLDKIRGSRVKAHWFDPREGTWRLIGESVNTGIREFMAPSSGEKHDWILVLDDAAKNYPVKPPKSWHGTGAGRVGITAVDFRSRFLAIGLSRTAPGFTGFSVDSLGQGKTYLNPVLSDGAKDAALRFAAHAGNRFSYSAPLPNGEPGPGWSVTCGERTLTLRSEFTGGTSPLPPFVLAFEKKSILMIWNERHHMITARNRRLDQHREQQTHGKPGSGPGRAVTAPLTI